jgi:hypothetical protein
MTVRISEATSAFLEAAAEDFQVQLGSSGAVEGMRLEAEGTRVALVATIRIGASRIDVSGRGGNLVTAYADLGRHVAEPILAAAYRELLGA